MRKKRVRIILGLDELMEWFGATVGTPSFIHSLYIELRCSVLVHHKKPMYVAAIGTSR